MALFDLEPETVAIVRLRTGLGDLLCGVPALRALRARLPRAHVVLITYAEMAPVVERQRAYVDELLPFPGWDGIPERDPDHAAIPSWLEAVRARRFDVALQCYGMRPAAHEVTLALGARRTGGFFVPGAVTPPDLDDWLPYPFHRQEADRHLDLMALLGAPPVDDGHLELPLTPEDELEAAALGLPAGRYVVLHPGASVPARAAPAELFRDVCRELSLAGAVVVVTGAPDERDLTAYVAGAGGADRGGRTDLAELAGVLAGAEAVVVANTGPAHLAAAVGTPVVSLFAPTVSLRRWAPYAVPSVVLGDQRAPCAGTRATTCPVPGHPCLSSVSVTDVLDALDSLSVKSALPDLSVVPRRRP